MDFATAFSSLSWLAVILATLSGFVIGGLWYSPLLFGSSWMRLLGLKESDLEGRSMSRIFGLTTVLLFVVAFFLALFIGPEMGVGAGAMAGFMVGLGWVAMLMGVQYLFENRSLSLFLINAGYNICTLTVMGAILGAF